MRVALYHPWIYVKGGIERSILELKTRSRHDWTIFTSRYLPEETFPQFQELGVVEIAPISLNRSWAPVAMACARLLFAGREWQRYDALMVSCDGIGNLVTLRAHGVPLLCLCHTPLKVAYDPLTNQRWRRLHKPGLPTRAGVHLFKWIDRWTWRRYRRVFSVSREVESRLQNAGVVEPGQTEVVHPGVDVDRMVPSGRREAFFLLPGRIMWTKNVELGIEAFTEMKRRHVQANGRGPLRLVVAGMVDAKSRSYLQHLRDMSKRRDDIEFVLSPEDNDLFDLYDRCFAVLFTPPNEDWGIVPLEAMAFGKPVVAVNQGGPTESVLDGQTGFLCEPAPGPFAGAMERLLADPELYERMSVAARKRALRYHWRYFVGQIDDYLDSLVSSQRQALKVL